MGILPGELAGIFSLLAYFTYISSAVRGKNRPSRASWFIWTVVGFIIASSYYFSGATTTMWVPICNSIGQFIIFLIALKYGKKGWTKFDKICLFGALFGLAMWLIFNSPLIGLMSNIFVDFMGALPTIKKSINNPEEEYKASWVLFTMANGTNLLALNTLSFAVVILPVYLFLLSLTITLLIFLRKKRIIIGGVVALFVLLIFGAMTNAAVLSDASGFIAENLDNLPVAQAVLVLGAKVKSDGAMSQILEDRVATGLKIYKTGKVQKILLSGDHGTKEYDEVNAMKKYLLNKGIPQQDIFLDHAGFDTYDSMYRAREIFHVRSMVVVTQKFHLPRAIFIARSLGIEASGYGADLRTYPGMYLNETREIFARIKAWLDVYTSARSKFLGPVIPIEGDGRVSWD